MTLMVGIVVASSLAWYAFVSMCMSSATLIRSFGRMLHRIERAAGVCFVAICGKNIADSRSHIAA